MEWGKRHNDPRRNCRHEIKSSNGFGHDTLTLYAHHVIVDSRLEGSASRTPTSEPMFNLDTLGVKLRR